MDNYSMSQVESLTGIKSSTLRAWERRYSFLNPLRSDTNIRYYTDSELRTLLNISILRANGYRISKIDELTSEEIEDAVFNIIQTKSGTHKEAIFALTSAMLAMDETAFVKIFNVHARRDGLLSAMLQLIYPFLIQVGMLWTTSKATLAQEHFISNLIRQKLIASIDELPIHKAHAPTIVMFLPENEMHEIGLLLAHFVAKDRGWKVIYLGQRVPVETLLSTTQIVHPQLLMTMVINSRLNQFGPLFDQIQSDCGIDILLSGPKHLIEDSTLSTGITYVASPDELISVLDKRKQSYLSQAR